MGRSGGRRGGSGRSGARYRRVLVAATPKAGRARPGDAPTGPAKILSERAAEGAGGAPETDGVEDRHHDHDDADLGERRGPAGEDQRPEKKSGSGTISRKKLSQTPPSERAV